MYHVRGIIFLNLQWMAPLLIRDELGAPSVENVSRSSFSEYRVCKEMLLCCSWLCILCFKSMEPLSFDSPAETDEVRRLPTFAKVFVSSPARN